MSNSEELIRFAEQNHTAENFIKAGNCCIVEDKYKLAAESFETAGHLYTANGNKYAAASTYVKAVDNYIKDNQDKSAKDLLIIAINLYLEDGKFGTAAKHLEKLADLYLKDKQILLAIENYIKANKYFCTENSKSTGTVCLYKAAELYVEVEKYSEAIDLLNQVYEHHENNKLSEFKCKGIMLEIGVLKLFIGDDCDTFLLTKSKHKGTREYELLDKLIDAIKNTDREKFTNLISEFPNFNLILKRIANKIINKYC